MEKEKKSSFSPVVIAMVVMVLIIGAFYFGKITNKLQISPLVTLQNQPVQIESQNSNLLKQQNCADQASKAFKNLGFPNSGDISDTYTDHYNKKLNKCFLGITSFAPGERYNAIYDANEMKKYADFNSVQSLTNSTEKPIVSCNLGDKFLDNCTDNDFQNFIKSYMAD